VEDNGFGISVSSKLQTPGGNIAANLRSFSGLTIIEGDGTDPAEAAERIERAVSVVRDSRVPVLLRLTVPRDAFAASASLAAEGITVELDLAGTVDVGAERKRVERDLAAARKEAQSMTAKLGNEAFTAKAPAAVIDKSRQRLAVAEADVSRLESRLAALG